MNMERPGAINTKEEQPNELRNFGPEGLEEIRSGPRDETLDRKGKMEVAAMDFIPELRKRLSGVLGIIVNDPRIEDFPSRGIN